MLRLLGAFFLVGGTAAMGFRASGKLRMRITVLSELATAIELIRSDLAFRQSDIPDLMKDLAERIAEPVRSLFRACCERESSLGQVSFSQVWNDAMTECGGLSLTTREKRELSSIGTILGRYDVDGQLSALGALHHRMEQLYDEAVRERENKGRVYSTLGVVTGLGLVILLL